MLNCLEFSVSKMKTGMLRYKDNVGESRENLKSHTKQTTFFQCKKRMRKSNAACKINLVENL